MAVSGLGQRLIINQYNVSGDVGSIDGAGCERGVQEVTSIQSNAVERIKLLADPSLDYSGYFNPDTDRLHDAVGNVPDGTSYISWLHSNSAGAPAISMGAVQISYDYTRGNDGSVEISVPNQGSDGTPMAWGNVLSDGIETVTAAGQTPSVDLVGASTSGWFTVHCLAFTGTTLTVKLQDSPDNSVWSDVDVTASTVFTDVGAARVGLTKSVTVDRYVRADISGTFTTADLVIVFSRGALS